MEDHIIIDGDDFDMNDAIESMHRVIFNHIKGTQYEWEAVKATRGQPIWGYGQTPAEALPNLADKLQ